MPQPQPANPSPPRVASGFSIAATVALAPAAVSSSSGYNLAQPARRQAPDGTTTPVTYNPLPGFGFPPGPPPLIQNGSATSSQKALPPTPPLWLQQRDNVDASGDSGTDATMTSRAPRQPSWPLTDRGSSITPSRSGSSGVSITSPDWASTTVEGGDEDDADRRFGTTNITPDGPNGTSKHQTQELILPCFERLMERREPLDLTGKVEIPDHPKPMVGGYGLVYLGHIGDRMVQCLW
jgi:hypothetical protein